MLRAVHGAGRMVTRREGGEPHGRARRRVRGVHAGLGPAPWTGAHVVVGPTVEVGKLKKALAHLEAGQDPDVRLRPVFPVPETEVPRPRTA